ncbi:hypothetical protein JCM5350_002066 [Sporobolomyces pararoseus]
MGISGLLPLLKEITVQKHVKDWKGKTLAVDGSGWLHRGAYGCAQELATGKSTISYVNYAMHRVRMLKYFGITPFIVFDGGLLPAKMETERDRERRRNEALAKGNALLAEGKTNQARDFFVKAVDVTPAMAYQLIKALRQEGIQYVVAPYEADPQLAYLEKKGLVDGIITEDSDLLVFGCKNVLFKLDGEGNCSAVSRQDFSKCGEYNFGDWSDAQFRQMAILSGCDYLKNIPGLGLKTAYRLMRKYKTAEKVIQQVKLEGRLTVAQNYLDEFRRAELTFLHQRVFDPVERELVHFSPLPEGKTAADMPFVGAELDREYACDLADGNIDPLSKQAVVDLMPNCWATTTIHRTTYKPTPSTSNSARPSSSISSKQPVQPAKGAASVVNFVSRARAASSRSTSGSNPVKNMATQKRVHLVGKGNKPEKEEKVESRKRNSKFCGKKVVLGETRKTEVKVSVKGKEKMSEVEEEDDVMIFEEEEMDVREHGREEEEDEDAESALRGIELEVCSSGRLVNYWDDAGNAKDVTPPTEVEVEDVHAPVPSPESTPCISSPAATPPRKAPPVKHSPVALKHPSSDGAIAISGLVLSAHANAGWEAESISSSPPPPPPPTIPQPLPKRRARPPAAIFASTSAAIKIEKPQAVKKRPTEVIQLSSDPIDNYSSDAQPGESTPRPPPFPVKSESQANRISSQDRKPQINHKQTKPLTSTSSRAAVQVRPDSNRTKSKEKKKVVEEEESDDEQDAITKERIRHWRERFMLGYPSSHVQSKTKPVDKAKLPRSAEETSLMPSRFASKGPAGQAGSRACVSKSSFLAVPQVDEKVRSKKRQKTSRDSLVEGGVDSRRESSARMVDRGSTRHNTPTAPRAGKVVNKKAEAGKRGGHRPEVLEKCRGELSSDPIENSSSDSESGLESDEIVE